MSIQAHPVTAPSILVVDDSPQNLQVVGATLGERMACELSFATNGQMALDSLAERLPDLVLLDIMMPAPGGLDICRRLKANPATAKIPVIFLTAKAEPEDILAGFEAGGSDYITKPFNHAELLARVGTHIQLKAAADEIAEKNSELRHLVQILCHDLANPIATLDGLLDTCAADPAAVAEILPDLRDIARQALDQILLVREMHRVQEGKYQLTILSFPLAEAVQAAAKNISGILHSKNLQISTAIPPDLEVDVEPVSFVNTVLANLLSNAAKFSFRGGKIAIAAERSGDREVRLTLQDFGVGIAPSRLEGVFLPRAGASTPGTEGEAGTGFGLPLVRSFVEVYGGQISLVSCMAPGASGTTVTLVLREGSSLVAP